MLDIYQYIAENDSIGSKMIANQYGYSLANVETADDMADVLEAIVAQNNEAFYQILDLHPDKDVILEVYAKKQNTSGSESSEKSCSCKDKSHKHSSVISPGFTMQQGNLFLIAAALLLSVAIIAKK